MPACPAGSAARHACACMCREQRFQQRGRPGQSCGSSPGRARWQLHGHYTPASPGLQPLLSLRLVLRMATVPTSVIVSSPSLVQLLLPARGFTALPWGLLNLRLQPRPHSQEPLCRAACLLGPFTLASSPTGGKGNSFLPTGALSPKHPPPPHTMCLQYLISPWPEGFFPRDLSSLLSSLFLCIHLGLGTLQVLVTMTKLQNCSNCL